MVLIQQPLIINGAQIKKRAKLFRSKHYVLEGGLGLGIIGVFYLLRELDPNTLGVESQMPGSHLISRGSFLASCSFGGQDDGTVF